MQHRDPLEHWYYQQKTGKKRSAPVERASKQNDLYQELTQLALLIERSSEKKINFYQSEVSLYKYGWNQPKIKNRETLELLKHVYRQILQLRGPGINDIQESLLYILGAAADRSSISFWHDMLEFKRPHDNFVNHRRLLSLAALAFIVLRHNTTKAYNLLKDMTFHKNVDIRANATHYLAQAYLLAERELPLDTQTRLIEIATTDTMFLPRLHARMDLTIAGLDVPLDNPNGVYEFHVSFASDKKKAMYRTIALRSSQTLEHLHLSIQRTLRWDNDHLYTFFLTGQKQGDPYEFVCPREKNARLTTLDGVIGELGFSKRHKFLYVFDYGDNHVFEIKVVGIHPKADGGTYPRLVESKGQDPYQYAQKSKEFKSEGITFEVGFLEFELADLDGDEFYDMYFNMDDFDEDFDDEDFDDEDFDDEDFDDEDFDDEDFDDEDFDDEDFDLGAINYRNNGASIPH